MLKKMATQCSYFLLVLWAISGAIGKDIEVRTSEGLILGRTDLTDRLKKPYYQFKGIPYAEPPERFQVSVPKSNWSGVLNCTYDKAECVQGTVSVTGSEDCLFLDVYSNNLKGKATVMVWIHGGRFIFGNASYESAVPDYFIEEDLVVVQIQYRLGIFGFLSTGDESCPGNFGLKDQIVALQWVHRNIHNFGGDRNKVTIFGESAGAVSVSLHLMSEKSKGLFRRAIMNSGVPLCLWSLTRNATAIAYTVANEFGVDSTASSRSLLEQLIKVDFKDLQQQANLVWPGTGLAGLSFGPVIEVPHPAAFLSGKSDAILSAGYFNKVPMLLGFNSNETVFQTPVLLDLMGSLFDMHPEMLVPADIQSNKNLTIAGEIIIEEFWGNNTVTSSLKNAIEFANVDQFTRPINRFVKDVCKYTKDVYYYMFSYVGHFPGISTIGVAHADELNYLFKPNTNYTEDDERITLRAVKMWSNFCKYGKPIPFLDPSLKNSIWLSACSTEPPFLFNIDKKMGRIEHPYKKELRFYDEEIYGVYGQGVYDTY